MEVDNTLAIEGVAEQAVSLSMEGSANSASGNSHTQTTVMGNYQNGPAENYSDLPCHPPLVSHK